MQRKWYSWIGVAVFLCLLLVLFVNGLEAGHHLVHHCFEENCRECALILIIGQMTRGLMQGPKIIEYHVIFPTVEALTGGFLWQFSRFSAVGEKVRLNC